MEIPSVTDEKAILPSPRNAKMYVLPAEGDNEFVPSFSEELSGQLSHRDSRITGNDA